MNTHEHSTIASTKNGFAMLFTVLVISIIMSLAIGIANVTFKQNLLSSIAKDSLVAFYAADAGVECGLYYDFTVGLFPEDLPAASAPELLACGNNTFSKVADMSYTNYIVYRENITDANKPCRNLVFDKTDATINLIQSRGYSVCSNTPRQVERALEVRY
ncbi:MAG TPA: hypothetical protein VGE18_02575 [Candidatus Paceibacterota bacterium]